MFPLAVACLLIPKASRRWFVAQISNGKATPNCACKEQGDAVQRSLTRIDGRIMRMDTRLNEVSNQVSNLTGKVDVISMGLHK